MKHKVVRIFGVLLLVLGGAIVILHFKEGKKSVVGSIAGGATPIIMGSMLVGVSAMLERKKAAGDPTDTPK